MNRPPAPSLRRFVRRLLLGLLPGIAVWGLMVWGTVRSSLHPVRLPVTTQPSAAFEDVTFRSVDDSVPLRGWFVTGKPARPIIVVCHGYPGNRNDVVEIVDFLHDAGYGVLTFDFRALGESGGDESTIGFREVNDALGAVAYLKTRTETRGRPFGILGLSMGGAVAIQAAAREPALRAVVADSAYASLDRAVDQRFRRYGGPVVASVVGAPAGVLGGRTMGRSLADVSPVAVVGKIAPRPLLLIRGTEDALVLPRNGQLLFDAAREPKSLWTVDGVGHIGAFPADPAAYARRVVGFFDSAFRR